MPLLTELYNYTTSFCTGNIKHKAFVPEKEIEETQHLMFVFNNVAVHGLSRWIW